MKRCFLFKKKSLKYVITGLIYQAGSIFHALMYWMQFVKSGRFFYSGKISRDIIENVTDFRNSYHLPCGKEKRVRD